MCLSALQAAKAGLDGAEQSLAATRSAEATSNATLAITEASNTAWRARQTAQAESAAEQQAMGASEAAGQSRSVRAYNAELAAAQSYNLVGFAGDAARAQPMSHQLPFITVCAFATPGWLQLRAAVRPHVVVHFSGPFKRMHLCMQCRAGCSPKASQWPLCVALCTAAVLGWLQPG